MFRLKHAVAGTLTVALLAANSFGFTLTATSFKGFAAFDKAGDVIGKFHLDPRFSYASTGKHFNFAAGLNFDVCYSPTPSPTAEDVLTHPGTDYLWSLSIQNAKLPWGGNLNFTGSTIASGSDLMGGVHWLKSKFNPLLPSDVCTAFDVQWISPNKGIANAFLAANVNTQCLPCWAPDQFICPWNSDATVKISAQEIPQNAVPEPMTLVLFGTGLAGLGLGFRRAKPDNNA